MDTKKGMVEVAHIGLDEAASFSVKGTRPVFVGVIEGFIFNPIGRKIAIGVLFRL